MVNKCWKKTKDTNSRTEFVKKESGKGMTDFIQIDKLSKAFHPRKYSVDVLKNPFINTKTKSKPEALKVARAYMKKTKCK